MDNADNVVLGGISANIVLVAKIGMKDTNGDRPVDINHGNKAVLLHRRLGGKGIEFMQGAI